MRRLYLIAAVFAVACGAPPTGVETELVGSDASLMARKGPKADGRKPNGPMEGVEVCAEDAGETQCSLRAVVDAVAHSRATTPV